MADNSSITNATNQENDHWAYGEALTYFAILILVTGLLSNVVTLLTLTWHGKGFPLMSRTLLRHQAIVDALVCVMGILMYSQDPMWMTGNDLFDHVLCQVWHGQAIFWSCVLVSVWNLILIAMERWLMICRTYKHRNMRLREMYKMLIAMYSISFVFLVPAFFQIRYQPPIIKTSFNVTTGQQNTSGKCLAGEFYFDNKHFKGFMAFYGVFWWLICYIIPVALFIYFYAKVIFSLREKRMEATPGSLHGDKRKSKNKVLKAADQQITRTAIIVTIVFFLSLSWDSWYCFFGFQEIIDYEFNSKLQVMGVFLAAFNSCTNPFIYAASMAIFRRCLKKTFTCQRRDFDSEARTTLMNSITRNSRASVLKKAKSIDSNASKVSISNVNSEPNPKN